MQDWFTEVSKCPVPVNIWGHQKLSVSIVFWDTLRITCNLLQFSKNLQIQRQLGPASLRTVVALSLRGLVPKPVVQ